MLEWAKQVGDAIEADETIVEISTDKVDAEVPAPASGTVTEILAEAGDTVTVGQVIGRMQAGARAAAQPTEAPAPEPSSAPAPGRGRRGRGPGRLPHHAGRQARGCRPRHRPLRRPGQRTRGPDRQGGRARRRQRRRERRRRGRRAGRQARRRHAHQGRLGDARALHGRVARGPDRDVLPHDHRHDARRAPQAAQGGRPPRLLHPPDRLRDRARRDRADAGHGAPLRRRSTASRT